MLEFPSVKCNMPEEMESPDEQGVLRQLSLCCLIDQCALDLLRNT